MYQVSEDIFTSHLFYTFSTQEKSIAFHISVSIFFFLIFYLPTCRKSFFFHSVSSANLTMIWLSLGPQDLKKILSHDQKLVKKLFFIYLCSDVIVRNTYFWLNPTSVTSLFSFLQHNSGSVNFYYFCYLHTNIFKNNLKHFLSFN